MPRAKLILKRTLVSVCLAALLTGAYWGGRRVARSGLVKAGPSTALQPIGEEAVSAARPPGSSARPERNATLARLMELGNTAPTFSLSAMEENWEMSNLVATLSTTDLAGLLAQIDLRTQYSLAICVAQAWIAREPTTAMLACLEKDPAMKGGFAAMIFANWAMDHPAVALAWLESDDLPAPLAALREGIRAAVLPQLAERDFTAAADSCRHADDATRSKILSQWGSQFGDNPEIRDQLVDFAKSSSNPADYAALNRQLVTAWPQDDAMGMMNYLIGLKDYLESGSVPAASRALVEGSAVAAAISREYDRPALEWWMERHASDTEIPMALQQGFGNWGRLHPDKAEQWLAEQPESPQKEALQASIVVAMAATAVECDKAAAMLEKIQDPEIRQQAATKLYLLWHESHPTAAETWKKGYAPQ